MRYESPLQANMPKSKDYEFKSPLKKLKEDILGKPSSSSSVSSSSSITKSHFESDALFESLAHDDHQLRRPMNAFLLFCKRHRQVVRTRHPWLDNRACTKMLADMWGALDGEEKEKYLQLARECKAAFMKAHPDYRWSGPNRHSGKVTNPGSITTRPHLTMKGEKEAGGKAEQGNSKAGITVGKLADPSQMGGLSLLLLAGQQEATAKQQSSSKPQSSSPPQPSSQQPSAQVTSTAEENGPPSHDQLKTTKRSEPESIAMPSNREDTQEDSDVLASQSKLLQFAEMCSDQLAIKQEGTVGEDSKKDSKTLNNNTIPLNSSKHVKLTLSTKSIKACKKASKKSQSKKGLLSMEKLCEVESSKPNRVRTEKEAELKARKDDKRIAEEGTKPVSKCRKVEKGGKKKKKKKKKVAVKTETTAVKKETTSDILSASWPGALKRLTKPKDGDVSDNAGEREDDDEKEAVLDAGEKSDGEECKNTVRRKSRRSCKGQLYRKLVDQGMLESLQRPERPFNCKKVWRHSNEGMSGFSDAEDEVFEPDDDRPKKSSKKWRSRKRTSSGSSVTASDFDYGEINVEARLANLPQYAPEQFRPKRKMVLKSKKRSDMYKNAKFVKENGQAKHKVVRSVSASDYAQNVTGSQKRKARKSAIMHLLPNKAESTSIILSSKNSPVSAENLKSSPFQLISSKAEVIVGAKVKRSQSDPQPFTLSDLAEAASMELKPCGSSFPTTTSGNGVDHSSLCLSAVKVS
ncbi:uncharacterized protein [Diadema setosum]|uniref:uncharacterized protein isoform X2 n=1 Tax=Diadema setosum TaxID=31175 RepID=UPI003B3A2D29